MTTRINKYERYLLLKEVAELAPHLPETREFSQENLWDMIDKYVEVILKPFRGQRGRGIIKVSSKGNETYKIHMDKERKKLQGKMETYKYVMQKIGSRKYMIQYRIPLAQIHGRPMDVRVMVQRKKVSDPWTVTGKAVKVAGNGYIITNNSRSRGTIMTVKEAMKKLSIDENTKRNILKDIDRVTVLAAKKLTEIKPKHRRYGFDIGLDKNNHVWIIEANRSPMVAHFRKLKDKTQYNRIMKFKKGDYNDGVCE